MAADAAEVRALLLNLGVALAMSGDAVSLIQDRLQAIAAVNGYEHARISVLPTLLVIALDEREAAGIRTIDSVGQLRLDQAADVIAVARRAEVAELSPAQAQAELEAALDAPARFGTVAYILSHAVLTLGIALLIRPATEDLWVYVALGILVGATQGLGQPLRVGRPACSPSPPPRSSRRSRSSRTAPTKRRRCV